MIEREFLPELASMPDPPAPPPEVADRELRLQFRGEGAEYFRIWIVNLLLSIVTLGIYSAWAKVRRLRYFYGNTYLDGTSFGYHADPKKILKGRVIAAAFFLAYTFGGQVSPYISGVAVLVLGIALPWIVVRSRIFQLRCTSFRNIRFGFERCYGQAIALYLGWGVLMVFTLGLLLPWWQARRYELLIANSRFGATRFRTGLRAGRFFGIYFRAALMGIGAVIAMVLVAMGAAMAGMGAKSPGGTAPGTPGFYLMMAAMYLVLVPLMLGIGAYVQTSILNVVYNATTLGPHRLRSELRAGRLFRIYLGNLALIVLTLGLYVPWARIRLARYRAETLAVYVSGSLDGFTGVEADAGSAVGEEVGDFFDVDFGL